MGRFLCVCVCVGGCIGLQAGMGPLLPCINIVFHNCLPLAMAIDFAIPMGISMAKAIGTSARTNETNQRTNEADIGLAHGPYVMGH